jgi:hypothetical protein
MCIFRQDKSRYTPQHLLGELTQPLLNEGTLKSEKEEYVLCGVVWPLAIYA